MKKLEKALKGHKHIVFLDFEGTQFSHEMIAIGGVLVSLDRYGRIKRRKDPFKIYVKAKNKIGNFVTNLTGITEADIAKNGVSFKVAMEKLKAYCGMAFKKSTFMTFGNHDMRILGQSIAYNIDFPKEICSQIQKNYFDFATFMNEFLRDANFNALSLIHACEFFKIEQAQPAHDPRADAINLANLYDAFVGNPDAILQEYKRVIGKVNHLPDPISKAVNDLASGKSVTPQDFEEYLKDYLK